MPFTALHAKAGRLDATQPDLGGGLGWGEVYKVRPRVRLTCPECGWGVHAKRSQYGVRFFCHDPGRPPECALANESWEHHMLKLELAGAVRDAGWYAELEAPAADGAWRADVLACSPDGSRRMAWEVQLSAITVDDIEARTSRYYREGMRVCWVSSNPQSPRWMGTVPGIRVRPPGDAGEWVIDDGVGTFDFADERWVCREVGLPRFVRWVVDGPLAPYRSLPRYRQATCRVDGRDRTVVRDWWWTSTRSARAQAEHDAMRQRQEEERERKRTAEEKRHQAEAARLREEQAAARQRRAERVRARQQGPEAEQRVRAEQRRRRQAAQEESRARERAAQEERDRRALRVATAWWSRLASRQRDELFAEIADRAWREERLRVEVREMLRLAPHFAYGVALYSTGPVYGLYGIVRPCPELVSTSPQLMFQRSFVRNAEEEQELRRVLTGRITDLRLPDE